MEKGKKGFKERKMKEVECYSDGTAVKPVECLSEEDESNEMNISLGDRWIPTALYEDFFSEKMQIGIRISYLEEIDDYVIATAYYNEIMRRTYTVPYGETQVYDAVRLCHDALCGVQIPNLSRPDILGNTRRYVPDFEARSKAGEKIDMLKQDFATFINNLPADRRAELKDMYVRAKGKYTPGGCHIYEIPRNVCLGDNLVVYCINSNRLNLTLHHIVEKRESQSFEKTLVIGNRRSVLKYKAVFCQSYRSVRTVRISSDYTSLKSFFTHLDENKWDVLFIPIDLFPAITETYQALKMVLKEELDKLVCSLQIIRSFRGFGGFHLRRSQEKSLRRKIKVVSSRLDEISYLDRMDSDRIDCPCSSFVGKIIILDLHCL